MMYDEGSGAPLLVIPGIQGRWEWMRPALRSLSRHFRVISYSLCGDIGSRMAMDPALGFDAFVRQIDDVLTRAKVDRVALCGVSFGGVIAVRYASARPERVRAVVLVSTPGPAWQPSERQARYVTRPWRSVPEFCATATRRLAGEIYAALPGWPARIGFTSRYLVAALASPMLPWLMARRVRLQLTIDFTPECAGVRAPTLVITGDPDLDRVVPVESTTEYVRLIPGARYEMMDRTGHLGLLTQPDRFATVVGNFLHACHP